MKILSKPIETNYDRNTATADLIRIRQESLAGTILSGTFLYLAVKNIVEACTGIAAVAYFTNRDKGNQSVSITEDYIKRVKEVESKINFLRLADLIVPVPQGFNGKWPEYVKLLEKQREENFHTAFAFLDSFYAYVAVFVSDKNTKVSNRSMADDFKKIDKFFEKQNKEFQSFFSGNQERQRIGKIFDDQYDIVPALQVAANNYKHIDKQDYMKSLKERGDRLVKVVGLVVDMQNSDEPIEISKDAMVNLAEGTHHAGLVLDHLAKFYVRSETAMTSSKYIGERVSEAVQS